MKTVTVTVNKKTLSEVYNKVRMFNDLGFPNFQKGEPINNLMKEIKRDVKKQMKTSKPNIFVRLKNAIWS